jgi:hypothetical protein
MIPECDPVTLLAVQLTELDFTGFLTPGFAALMFVLMSNPRITMSDVINFFIDSNFKVLIIMLELYREGC